MAAKAGRDFLLEYHNGSTYVTMGGLRTRRMRVGRAIVDVTTSDSSGLERALLANGGVAAISISGDGVFEDSAAQGAAEAAARAGTFLTMRITIPDYGSYLGSFAVTDFEFGGDFDKELTFSCSFESSGQIPFTADE